MRTIYTTLPIFDSVDKQDYERIKGGVSLHCPLSQLPPFQFEHDTEIVKFELINCEETSLEITPLFAGARLFDSWTNVDLDAYSASGGLNFSYNKAVAAGVTYAHTGTISIATGDVIILNHWVITGDTSDHTSEFAIVDSGGSDISNVVTAIAEANLANTSYVTSVLIATGADASARIRHRTVDGESYVTGTTVSIRQLGRCIAGLAGLTTDYYVYEGDFLRSEQYAGGAYYELPVGTYYLKLTDDDDTEFFSEWFTLEDIYPNLISAFSGNAGYETFTTNGTTLTSIINTAGTGAFRSTDTFAIKAGETITVSFYYNQVSGDAPLFRIYTGGGAGTLISNTESPSAGINTIELTATSTSLVAWLRISNSTNTNFSTSKIFVTKSYSENFTKMTFSNTKDLPTPTNEPTIYYSGGFEDEIWFKTKLNAPGEELLEIGNEKDGVFIAEKIVAKYNYKIIDYTGRNLWRALHRLSLHDDITIIDDVGNEYSVAHNARPSMEWNTYETGKLTIIFNDGASIFANNLDNLT